MKKTLAALAVLGAFAGSACAANVQLYGVLDTGLQYKHVNPDDGTDGTDTFTMATGNQSGNRWGLKGVEDLGNGYQVGFLLESGFSEDDGTLGQAGRLFGREANLFVRGAFGELSFGRLGALDSANGSYGLLGNFSPFGASWAGSVEFSTYFSGGLRLDNAVTYKSPDLAGARVYAQYSFGANSKDVYGTKQTAGTEGKASDNRYAALGATYQNGALSLAAAAGWYNYSNLKYADADDGYTLTAGGSYDFEVVKAYFGAQYVNNLQKASSDADTKTVNNYRGFGFTGAARGWGLMAGVDAPVAGGKAMFAVGYSHLDADKGDETQTNSAAEFERVGASVGYTYAFSKRTNVYGVASFYQDTNTDAAGKDVRPETSLVTVGVRHTF